MCLFIRTYDHLINRLLFALLAVVVSRNGLTQYGDVRQYYLVQFAESTYRLALIDIYPSVHHHDSSSATILTNEGARTLYFILIACIYVSCPTSLLMVSHFWFYFACLVRCRCLHTSSFPRQAYLWQVHYCPEDHRRPQQESYHNKGRGQECGCAGW